jgi:hypothetical protein
MAKRTWRQNILRIDHIVMVAEPENVDSAAETFAKLLDIEWEGPFDAEEVGLRCYVSWDAGLELVAPFDKAKMPDMAAFLGTHGEGIYRVVFGVGARRIDGAGSAVPQRRPEVEPYLEGPFRAHRPVRHNPRPRRADQLRPDRADPGSRERLTRALRGKGFLYVIAVPLVVSRSYAIALVMQGSHGDRCA